MFEFFKMGRGKPGQDDSLKAEASPLVPDSRQQHVATSRELARGVLRDTLSMNGIPDDWISCDSSPRTHGSSDGSLLIQLVINRWHESLMSYAPLLQQQFQQGLQRLDPASDHSRHLVVWRFSPFCGYPGTVMPAADFWLSKPDFTAKRKFDLPPSDLDHLDDGFAPTIPGELR